MEKRMRYHDSASMNGLINENYSEPACLPQGFKSIAAPDMEYGLNDAPPMLYRAAEMEMRMNDSKLKSLRLDPNHRQ